MEAPRNTASGRRGDSSRDALDDGSLRPTNLALGESAPVAIGLLVALPFLATPWLLKLILHAAAVCAPGASCAADQHGGLWLLTTLLGAEHLPAAFARQPAIADVVVGIASTVLVILLLALLRVPILAGFSPVLKITQPARPRSGTGFDFIIRHRGRPHRITIHLAGMFAGYPGDGFVALKLHLPTGETQSCEQTVRPVAQAAKRNGVADYLFDPIYFQFTPQLGGKTHLWVGYGSGPECKLKLTVQRRS